MDLLSGLPPGSMDHSMDPADGPLLLLWRLKGVLKHAKEPFNLKNDDFG